MKISLFTLIIACLSCLSLNVYSQQANDKLDIRDISFRTENGIIRPDTFSISFNVYQDGKDRIRNLDLSGEVQFRIEETRGNRPVPLIPEYIEGSLALIDRATGEQGFPDDLTVSLLVDRSGSISAGEMSQIREAVRAFVYALPEGSVFLSYFHNFISRSYPVSRATFEDVADPILVRTELHTDLHNAVITKLLEFDSLAVIPNQVIDEQWGYERTNELARRGSRNNVLIILSDGLDDDGMRWREYPHPNPKYHHHPVYGEPDPNITPFDTPDEVYEYIRQYRNQVTVFTIGFGAARSDFHVRDRRVSLEDILGKMATEGGGGYFYANPDEILDLLQEQLPDELMPDYRAVFVNPPGKVFTGRQRDLKITLVTPGMEATGHIDYAIGSLANPVESQPLKIFTIMGSGLLAGLILILLVLIIIQMIWPLINNQLFNMRYKRRYIAPPAEQKRTCPYCLDTINPHDKIISKCAHIVHSSCWVNNDHMCPEFGQNCTTGKQNYFDINDPFARKNKVYYLNWVLYGLFGGLMAWVTFLFLKDLTVWYNMANTMVNWFAPGIESSTYNYAFKLAPLYVLGLVMGFFLTLLFSWAEEYRQKNAVTILRFVLRSIIGAAIGMLSFLVGSIFIILFKQPDTNFLVDWIPWLIFGVLLGLSLSVKTTIDWKHGLLGGLISILFSFIMLYYLGYAFSGVMSYIAAVISFMLYGAGLGGAIATVRSTAEQYFLKILNGPKNGTHIAIHKWMSSQSGLNEVYVGKSNVCEIQMNWEKSNEIAEKHAKIYLNTDRKMPVLVSLEKGKTTLYDERVEMTPGKEYDLLNGTTFTISETIFQYVETRDD